MYKKRKKKIIAIKHCLQHFTTANTPKLQRAVHPFSTLGDDSVERQRQLHAYTHRGCLRGCALSEAENFVFLKLKLCNMEYKCKFRSGDE